MIFILDEIDALPGVGRGLHDLYLADYAQGARERGMTLEQVLVSPPLWLDDGVNRLLFLWSVPDSHGFWHKNNLGRRDPEVQAVWTRIDALSRSRRRETFAAPSDFGALAGG